MIQRYASNLFATFSLILETNDLYFDFIETLIYGLGERVIRINRRTFDENVIQILYYFTISDTDTYPYLEIRYGVGVIYDIQ